jgi:hypothetical protein
MTGSAPIYNRGMFLIIFLLCYVMVGEMTSEQMAGVIKRALARMDIDWHPYKSYIDTYCSNPRLPHYENLDRLTEKYPEIRTYMLQKYFEELPEEVTDTIDFVAYTHENVSFEENVRDIIDRYHLQAYEELSARDAKLMEELFKEESEQAAAEHIYHTALGVMEGLPAESVMPRVMEYVLSGLSKREKLDAAKDLVDTLTNVLAEYKLTPDDVVTAEKLKEVAERTVDIAAADKRVTMTEDREEEEEPVAETDALTFDEDAIKQAALEERKRQAGWRARESEQKHNDKTFWDKIEEQRPPAKEKCKLCGEYHYVGSDIYKKHQAELEKERQRIIAKQQEEYEKEMTPQEEEEEGVEVTDDDIAQMLGMGEPESMEDLVRQKKELDKEKKRTSIPPEHPFIDTRHMDMEGIPRKILSGLKIVFKEKNIQKVLNIINKITHLHFTEDAVFEFEEGGEGRYLPFDLTRIKDTLEYRPTTQRMITKEGDHLLKDVIDALEAANVAAVDTSTGKGEQTVDAEDMLRGKHKKVVGYIDWPIDFEDIRFISEALEKWEREHEYPSQVERQHRQEEVDRLKDKLKGLD